MTENNVVWQVRVPLLAQAVRTPVWNAPRALRVPPETPVGLTPGTWALALGQQDYAGRPLYRLAAGQVVSLEAPLDAAVADEICDPQVIAAMTAWSGLEAGLRESFGLGLSLLSSHLHPFALIKCPLCEGTAFTTVDFASVWCDGCNAQFLVRSTAGDPGFVVDCSWEYAGWRDVRYIVPPGDGFRLTLCLKDSSDPRDLI